MSERCCHNYISQTYPAIPLAGMLNANSLATILLLNYFGFSKLTVCVPAGQSKDYPHDDFIHLINLAMHCFSV